MRLVDISPGVEPELQVLVGGDQLEVVEDWHVDPAHQCTEQGEDQHHGQHLRP